MRGQRQVQKPLRKQPHYGPQRHTRFCRAKDGRSSCRGLDSVTSGRLPFWMHPVTSFVN
jgi:hypothetical protein